jgi:hypothetical protein
LASSGCCFCGPTVGLAPHTAPLLVKQKAGAAKQAKHVARVFRAEKAAVPHLAAQKDILARKPTNAASPIAQKVAAADRAVPQAASAHEIKNAVPSNAIKADVPKEAEPCYAIQPDACDGIPTNDFVAHIANTEQAAS